jgi:hypothetical protein
MSLNHRIIAVAYIGENKKDIAQLLQNANCLKEM